jgi:hypothetical protein
VCEHQPSGLTHLSIDNRSKAFLSLTQKSRGEANRKDMQIFGEQKNCLLDIFQPYQRPGKSASSQTIGQRGQQGTGLWLEGSTLRKA